MNMTISGVSTDDLCVTFVLLHVTDRVYRNIAIQVNFAVLQFLFLDSHYLALVKERRLHLQLCITQTLNK